MKYEVPCFFFLPSEGRGAVGALHFPLGSPAAVVRLPLAWPRLSGMAELACLSTVLADGLHSELLHTFLTALADIGSMHRGARLHQHGSVLHVWIRAMPSPGVCSAALTPARGYAPRADYKLMPLPLALEEGESMSSSAVLRTS